MRNIIAALQVSLDGFIEGPRPLVAILGLVILSHLLGAGAHGQ